MELGLLYYKARYYLPGVGRFISADTIVPDPTNPQQYNRYTCVLNNPIRNSDPSGHTCQDQVMGNSCILSDGFGNNSSQPTSPTPQPTNPLPTTPTSPMVTFSGCETCTWSEAEMTTIRESATLTGTRLAETMNASNGWNLSASEAFLLVYGGSVDFHKTGGSCFDATGFNGCWGSSRGRNSIHVYTDIVDTYGVNQLIGDPHWAVHELGHSFVSAVGAFDVWGQRYTLPSLLEAVQGLGYVPDRPPGSDRDSTWGFAGGRWKWQRSSSGLASEEFADMYLGWVYGQ